LTLSIIWATQLIADVVSATIKHCTSKNCKLYPKIPQKTYALQTNTRKPKLLVWSPQILQSPSLDTRDFIVFGWPRKWIFVINKEFYSRQNSDEYESKIKNSRQRWSLSVKARVWLYVEVGVLELATGVCSPAIKALSSLAVRAATHNSYSNVVAL
jgi:hypothetical protein